jgi:hypothetical protein
MVVDNLHTVVADSAMPLSPPPCSRFFVGVLQGVCRELGRRRNSKGTA